VVAFRIPQRVITVMRECVLEETLPARHLARFIWAALERLDFAAVESRYKSISRGTGRPPYHPRILAALWIYGMTRGIGTASDIAEGCTIRDDFRWLAGGLAPCDQTLLNFLSIAGEDLPGIWEQVLKTMQAAGCIDLSILAEDGTKLRANASRRSFHSSGEIDAVVEKLKSELARELENAVSPEASKAHRARLQALKGKLERASQAAAELQRRKESRQGQADAQHPPQVEEGEALTPGDSKPRQRRIGKFRTAEFTHDPDRDVVLCPQKQELRFVGVYPTDNGSGSYRLYKRVDCTGCPIKARCTDAKGRRVKLPVVVQPTPPTVPGYESSPTSEDSAPSDHQTVAPSKVDDATPRPAAGPQASLTDPEALLMLATSEKRFEPSYNADLTVTRDEVIVSQFLTKSPVDFAHFPRALPNVISTLGHPEKWTGDGHYATLANLVLAQREAVVLYAPTQDRAEKNANRGFTIKDFRWDPEQEVLTCPAGSVMEKIGTYGQDQQRPYDLYVGRDCTGCELKPRCTTARGRRVRRYQQHTLVQALEARMESEDGEKMRKFRGSTAEPVNGQLKLHGLDRFHVRGLARCSTVLTLACIAHNLMKWRGMEEGRATARAQAAS
jgi:transposase